MAATLDLPVELGDPFKKLTGATKDVPLTGAIAIGLALRALEKKPGEPNLLPAESRGDMEGLLKPIGISAGAAVAILGLFTFLSMVDISSWEQKISTLKGQEISIRSAQAGTPLTDLQTIQTKQQAQLRFVRNVAQMAKDHTALLTEITKLLPEEAWLRYLSLDDSLQVKNAESMMFDRKKILRLSGGSYAQNPSKEFEGINNFLAALRANALFQRAFAGFNLDSVQRGIFQEEEVTEFRLTCSSNPEDAKSEAQNPSGGWNR
jgi:Tfp pilus assembly protein PilN